MEEGPEEQRHQQGAQGRDVTCDDEPSLEEACLWADLQEVAEERDAARRELAAALAENTRLRAQLAHLTALAA
jgi:hypothetical protein